MSGHQITQSSRRPTQNDRILELLADGRWHTTREILAHVPCIVHSRIAEINGRPGYRIEHRGGGAGAENHEYRLIGTPDEAARNRGLAAESEPVAAASSGASSAEPCGAAAAQVPVQLDLLAQVAA